MCRKNNLDRNNNFMNMCNACTEKTHFMPHMYVHGCTFIIRS